ncbi:protein PFC0760c [Octopus bimaculoides]|nr:protein PFC0760c [Octopus bimaculoides]
MRSKINVLYEFFCSVEQMCKNFGRYLFDSVVVKTALYRLENVIKTSEVLLKRLLRVIDGDNSVVYRCHRCQFLSSVSAHNDYASSEDETVQIRTQRDCGLTDADHITENGLSGPQRENLSTSLEKAAEKVSSETANDADKRTKTVDGTGQDSETTDVAGNWAKPACSAGNDIETTNASDSEGGNTDTIHNGLINAHREVEGIEKFFILFYKTFVLYPFNAYVAVLHFIRNVTFDANDYCQKLGPITSSGRKIVSPRRMIRNRFLLQLKKMTNEVVNLAAADDRFKLFLAETGDLIINCNQSTSRKRKISLDDLDACSSSSGDPDYVPEIPYSDLESESLSEEDFSGEDDEIEDCEVPQDTHGAETQTDGVKHAKDSNNGVKDFDIKNKINDIKDIENKMNDARDVENETNEDGENEKNESVKNEGVRNGENEMNEDGENETSEGVKNETNEGVKNEMNEGVKNEVNEDGENEMNEGVENEMKEGVRNGENEKNEDGENEKNEDGENEMNEDGENETNEDGENETNEGVKNEMNEGGKNEMNEGGKNEMNEGGKNEMNEGGKNEMNEGGKNEMNEGGKNEMNEGGKNEMNEGVKNEVNEDGENEMNEGVENEMTVNGIQASNICETDSPGKEVILQNNGKKTAPVSEEVD